MFKKNPKNFEDVMSVLFNLKNKTAKKKKTHALGQRS